jgi:hypothetical protein
MNQLEKLPPIPKINLIKEQSGIKHKPIKNPSPSTSSNHSTKKNPSSKEHIINPYSRIGHS